MMDLSAVQYPFDADTAFAAPTCLVSGVGITPDDACVAVVVVISFGTKLVGSIVSSLFIAFFDLQAGEFLRIVTSSLPLLTRGV
jgi:hypothetical protein